MFIDHGRPKDRGNNFGKPFQSGQATTGNNDGHQQAQTRPSHEQANSAGDKQNAPIQSNPKSQTCKVSINLILM